MKEIAKQLISEEELIHMTAENVRSFYNRNKGYTTAAMTKDFMWIGSNDFQWCEGLDTFLRVTRNEYEEPPVLLSDEEYHLLFHDHNTWVIYGRYKATVVLPDNSVIYAHVRGTYVWRRVNGTLRLAHVHGSHAQDIPLNQSPLTQERLSENSAFFDYMKRMDTLNSVSERLAFRGKDGMHHYFSAEGILYLQADNQGCILCTNTGEFAISGLLAVQLEQLPAQFLRIHKSYVVNLAYVVSTCRYQAVLANGQALPVSKMRYQELKQRLTAEQP